tara:strand:+ start:7883 stop:9550 length:1668 start_codon:yes stop_codon:yes gene_type:complete
MSDIKLITLTSYSRPPLVEDKSKDWVMNGRNNDYYNYIISRNNGSPTNSSINQSYSTLIYGKGLRTSSGSLGAENWGRLQTILRPRELRKMVADFQVFGEFSFEVIETKGGELHSLTHIPKQMVIPSIANEKNEIEHYWFSKNWRKYTDVENTPVLFNAYGAAKGNSVYVAKPYVVGAEYFGAPSYTAALVYAEMEEEIANVQISSIKNGLSAGYIIQIPNGTNYTPEEKEEFERQVKRKLVSSSNASNFIISFNDQEVAIEVTPFPVNANVHKQWETLTKEAKNQIMTAHKVISPSLVGLSSASGFSSVADEMDMSERQTIKRVIKPKQDFILDSIEEVLINYGINLDLHFAPLTEEIIEVKEETAELSSHVCMSEDIQMFAILEKYALDSPEGYELTDGKEYDVKMSANQTSEQDTKLWKTRYAFTKGTSKTPKGQSRSFCNKMVSLSDAGKVYRKEDIELMSQQGVNGKFAHSGGKYDIFLYGGGVNCYHRFERRVFKKKLKEDGKPKGGGAMQQTIPVNVNEAKRQGYKPVKNSPDVAIAEIDKPNNGRFK